MIKYLFLVALGSAFLLICMTMALFGDRHRLIKKKLKTGAPIIALNGVVAGIVQPGKLLQGASFEDAGVDAGVDDNTD